MANKADRVKKKSGKALRIWQKNWQYLLLCLPSVVGMFFFHYVPIVGILMTFEQYTYRGGIFGSKWVGLKNFEMIFRSPDLPRLIRNTVSYSVAFTIIGHASAIFLALMLYELRGKWAKKFYQTSMLIPNFLSWVIVGYITYAIFNPTLGILNQIRDFFHLERIDVYANASYWPLILTLVSMWKGINGYLFYYSCLMGIPPELFEAATIDGANSWQKRRYIAFPALIPLLSLFLIQAMSGIFSGDFGLFYTIPRNIGQLYETTDIINTYVFRGLQGGKFTLSAAVGLIQSVIGMLLLLVTNGIVRKVSPENAMF